tara:strand:+ start:832 stop:1080 length:249 start_codon:yes stop_codon:yes gene_type:complete
MNDNNDYLKKLQSKSDNYEKNTEEYINWMISSLKDLDKKIDSIYDRTFDRNDAELRQELDEISQAIYKATKLLNERNKFHNQ